MPPRRFHLRDEAASLDQSRSTSRSLGRLSFSLIPPPGSKGLKTARSYASLWLPLKYGMTCFPYALMNFESSGLRLARSTWLKPIFR